MRWAALHRERARARAKAQRRLLIAGRSQGAGGAVLGGAEEDGGVHASEEEGVVVGRTGERTAEGTEMREHEKASFSEARSPDGGFASRRRRGEEEWEARRRRTEEETERADLRSDASLGTQALPARKQKHEETRAGMQRDASPGRADLRGDGEGAVEWVSPISIPSYSSYSDVVSAPSSPHRRNEQNSSTPTPSCSSGPDTLASPPWEDAPLPPPPPASAAKELRREIRLQQERNRKEALAGETQALPLATGSGHALLDRADTGPGTDSAAQKQKQEKQEPERSRGPSGDGDGVVRGSDAGGGGHESQNVFMRDSMRSRDFHADKLEVGPFSAALESGFSRSRHLLSVESASSQQGQEGVKTSLGLGGMVSDLGVTGAERPQQAGKESQQEEQGSQQAGQREEEQSRKEDFKAEPHVFSLKNKNKKHDRDDFRVTEAELRHVFETLDANGDGKVVSVT